MTGLPRKLLTRSTDFILLIVIIIVWEIVTSGLRIIPAYLFPSFSQVVSRLSSEVVSGKVLLAAAFSLYRFSTSLMIGVFGGILVGWILGWYKLAYRIAAPLIYSLYPIPMISLYGLFIIWVGLTDQAIIAVGAVTAFFQVLLNTITGVKDVDPILVRAARDYGANDRQIAVKVVFPSAVPLIVAGFKLAVIGAFIVDVTAEMIFTPPYSSGLGWSVAFYAFIQNDPAGTLSALLVLAIVGGVIINFAEYLDKKAARWRRAIKE
jgi:NitT/TauT family transport system permease protein